MPFTPDSQPQAPDAPSPGFKPDAPAGDQFDNLRQDLAAGRQPGMPELKPGWANQAAMALVPGIGKVPGLSGYANGLKNFLGKVGQGALTGGAAAEAYGPEASGAHVPDPTRVGIGMGVGGATSGILAGLEKFLRGSGDVAMQASVGRKKYTPGVGTTLADEGIWGTENRMKNQVSQGLESRGQEISDVAKQIPADITQDAGAVANDIGSQQARKFTVPGAKPSAMDQPKLDKIDEFVQDVAGRGQETGEQMLARRVAAGQRAYSGREDPLQSLIGQMSKQEQRLYSEGLGKAATAASPELGAQLSGADKAYGALKRAERGLDTEPSLPKSIMGLLNVGPKLIPGGALGMSSAGQALTKGSQAVDPMTIPLIRSLFNANQSEK